MKPIIEISHLNKRFGEVQAVKDLSFHVEEGELFAFLGINGAGKSTTINMLCGQLLPDAGEIRIDGRKMQEDPDGIKRKLGIVFQNSVLDKALSVRDNLESRAALYGITGKAFQERLDELSEQLDFQDLLKRAVGKLSGGQRRRIDIARALLHKPQILILDEPTTGLDPQTRKILWNVVERLRKNEKMTVLLTTHYMEEAAGAGYVVIIDKGSIVAKGTPLELKNTYSGDCVTIYNAEEAEIRKLEMPYEKEQKTVRLFLPNTAKATELILEHPEVFRDYEIVKGKMEDVFLAVTGKTLTGGEQA